MLPLPVDLACPPSDPGPVAVELITAGQITNDWKRVVDDGTTGPVTLPATVGVLRHPKALVTVDAGLGQKNRDKAQPGFPVRWARADMDVPAGSTVVEQLGRAPDLVLLTHLHYDHIGGLLDMPGVRAWTGEADWWTYGGGNLGFPPRLFRDAIQWEPQDFEGPGSAQILGRPAQDVLGDGTIWYLSLPGHTPGSAAVLARGAEGPVLFVGDTGWVDKHLADAMRPWMVSLVIDARKAEHRESLAWARAIKAQCPALRVVTGHEPADLRPVRPPAAP